MGKCVNWECASAVSIGTAHTERGGRCEDRCSSRVFDQAGAPWLAMFVSDGAGSAECGEQGADIAVRTANETVSQLMQLAELPLDESWHFRSSMIYDKPSRKLLIKASGRREITHVLFSAH